MKKNILLLAMLFCMIHNVYSQTFHSIIFANKEEKGREADRTAEYNNMSDFCQEMAESLGYRHDLRRHSGQEFTSIMAEKEISNLQVGEGDIVIFYYDGHGCNWDKDDWPHMAFLDKQYWETTLYEKLKAACKKAKLTLLIAGCCNMDSEGRRSGGKNRQYAIIDKLKVRSLFTGFDGNISIKSSASHRGQVSYSLLGQNMGNVYAINIRYAIRSAVSASSKEAPTWDAVMKEAAKGAYDDTRNFSSGPQQPQHIIEKSDNKRQSPHPPTPTPTSVQSGKLPEASFKRVVPNLMSLKDGGHLSVLASFETHHMNEQGGRIVVFINEKEARSIEFGTHYIHNSFSNKVVMIPSDKLRLLASTGDAKIRVGIYDYKQKKFIAYSDYMNVKFK